MITPIFKAQKKYKKALLIEFGLLVTNFFILLVYKKTLAFAFIAGAFTAFLPFACFVLSFLWVKKIQNINIKRFYLAELLKIVLTSILFIVFFVFFAFNMTVFFAGFLLSIVLNNLIPFFIIRH